MDPVVVTLLSLLALGFLTVVYLIAADKQRFLTRYDLSQWRQRYYLSALPNFLQACHDHRFKTPFPAQLNAVSASYFRYRLRPIVKRRPGLARRRFVHNHIALIALIEKLKPYLQDFLLWEQQRLVTQRVLEMEDTADRDRLLSFIETARAWRGQFHQSLSSYDKGILVEMVDRAFVPTLRTIHAIFQEHGYSLMPEFNRLRRWESLTGSELAQELPEVHVKRSKKAAPVLEEEASVDFSESDTEDF